MRTAVRGDADPSNAAEIGRKDGCGVTGEEQGGNCRCGYYDLVGQPGWLRYALTEFRGVMPP